MLKLQTERQLDCALDLMRRLPPQQIEKNLSDLIDLVCICVMKTSLINLSKRVPIIAKEKISFLF